MSLSAALETFSKRIRKKIHLKFYDLGCFIQNRDWVMLLLSTLLLVLCLIPLNTKKLKVDTEIEALWVASTGRLHDELQYTFQATNRTGFDQDHGYEVFMQVVEDDDENILTKQRLEEHLDVLKRIKNDLIVSYGGVDWSLEHLCDRYDVDFFQVSPEWRKVIDRLSPCLIMTPLDCFWEGSFIASYGGASPLNDYTTTNPSELVDNLRQSNDSNDHTYHKKVLKFVNKIGLGVGYMDRPCFGGNVSKCPTAVTKDIPANLKGGCNGVAKNYMRWPEDLIVSGTIKNNTGYIKRAKAIQSVLQLKDPSTFKFDAYGRLDLLTANRKETNDPDFAEKILNMWKTKFTEFVNQLNEEKKYKSKMLAFSTKSFEGLIHDFSNINKKYNAYTGLGILTLYTVFTLKRWSSTVYSYGFVGLIGVAFSVLSVFSGIGLSYLSNMNLSSISVQVLPYLALGLGLDYMFLMARTYLFVCDSRKFKSQEIIGMCLGEVGFDITLASVTNTIAFLMASLVPIGAVQIFARQAAIIYTVNWFTVMFTFSSFLAIDVKRQTNQHYDLLFCCKKGGNDDDEVEYDNENNNNRIPEAVESNFQYIFPGTNVPPISAAMTINPPYQLQEGLQHSSDMGNEPPQHFKLNRARRARKQSHRVFNVSERDRERKKRKAKKEGDKESNWKNFVFKLSLTYFAQRYYGSWMVKTPVKATIMALCAVQLIVAVYGTLKAENGLQIDDMLPEGTYQHDFMVARQKYFSYYRIFVITRNTTDGQLFDYASKENQRLMYEFYDEFKKINYVVNVYDEREQVFWLPVFRDWLKEIFEDLKVELRQFKNRKVLCSQLQTQNSQMLYHIMGAGHNPADGAIEDRELVDKDGYINPDLFYLALSFWYNTDHLGLWKSEIEILPTPSFTHLQCRGATTFDDDISTFKAAPAYMRIPFQVHKLDTNEDYLTLIKEFRKVCEKFKEKGLNSYPTGIPFTYWEQFILLDYHLIISLVVVLSSVFIISFICLLNFRAASIITVFLAVIFFESYGFIGLCRIKLSAITLIPLMLSTGIGTQFVVHSVLAFINTQGSRNQRMRGSLEIMFASVLDCSISSIIMIVLMATSEYQFIIKYFVQLMIWIVCVAMVNTLLVLPVMLSVIGPCPPESHRAVAPANTPRYFVRFPDGYEEWMRPKSRHSLSTIPEEHSCLNDSRDNQRPVTPFLHSERHCSNHAKKNSSIILEDYDDNENDVFHQETSFSPRKYPTQRAQTPAWTQVGHRGFQKNGGHRHYHRNSSRTTKHCCGSMKCPSQDQSEHNSNQKTHPGNSKPIFIQVCSSEDNRVTTKVKATLSVECETSHPFSPRYADDLY